jgi:hypothetical protein
MPHRHSQRLWSYLHAPFLALALAAGLGTGVALAQTERPQTGATSDILSECQRSLERIDRLLKSHKLGIASDQCQPSPSEDEVKLCPSNLKICRLDRDAADNKHKAELDAAEARNKTQLDAAEGKLKEARYQHESLVQDVQTLLNKIISAPSSEQTCNKGLNVEYLGGDGFRVQGSAGPGSALPETLRQLSDAMKTAKIEIDIKPSLACDCRAVGNPAQYCLMEDQKGAAKFVLRSTLNADQSARLPSSSQCDELGNLLLKAAKDDREGRVLSTGFWARPASGTNQVACTLEGNSWEIRSHNLDKEQFTVLQHLESH